MFYECVKCKISVIQIHFQILQQRLEAISFSSTGFQFVVDPEIYFSYNKKLNIDLILLARGHKSFL